MEFPKCVFRWAAFFNFKRGNWSRLMPSQNSVLEKRMPIFGKRMPLHSHVFENGCPRMPSNGQNGCPELKKLVKNKSPAPKPGHPGEEQQGGPVRFTGSERSGSSRNVPCQAS